MTNKPAADTTQEDPDVSDKNSRLKKPKHSPAWYDKVASFSAGATGMGWVGAAIGGLGTVVLVMSHLVGALLFAPIAVWGISAAAFSYSVSRYKARVARSFPGDYEPNTLNLRLRNAGKMCTAAIGVTAALLTISAPKLVRVAEAVPDTISSVATAVAFNHLNSTLPQSSGRLTPPRPVNQKQAGLNLC